MTEELDLVWMFKAGCSETNARGENEELCMVGKARGRKTIQEECTTCKKKSPNVRRGMTM